MILGSLIVVISILALAGMSFPVVRGVSGPGDALYARRGAGPGAGAAEKLQDQRKAAETKADRESRGLAEVDNKDKVEQRRRVFKQCALMSNLDKINKLSRIEPENYMIIDSKEPYEVLSKLTMPRDVKNKDPRTGQPKVLGPDTLFTLTSDEISSLVPKVRMFKVVYPIGSEGDPEQAINIELPFDDHTDPGNILNITNNYKGRAGGVGLKSFEWASLGTNPANVNIFEANVTIYFQSIDQLFEKRRKYPEGISISAETREKGVRFADLLVQQTKFKDTSYNEKEKFNEDYFRLKAVVGWAQPTGEHWKDKDRKENIQKLLSVMTTNMSLSLVSHELDFREDGSLEVKIKYISSVEGMMNSPKANILRGDPAYNEFRKKAEGELKAKRKEFDSIYAEVKEGEKETSGQTDEDSPEKEELKKEIEDLEADVKNRKITEKSAKYSIFLSQLLLGGKVKVLSVPKKTVDDLAETVLSSGDKKRRTTIAQYKNRIKQTEGLNSEAATAIEQGGIPPEVEEKLRELYKNGEISAEQTAEEVEAKIKKWLEQEQAFKESLGKQGFAALSQYVNEKLGRETHVLDNVYINSDYQGEKIARINQALSDASSKQITDYVGEGTKCGEEHYLINFFRLGDLVDVVLRDMFLPENKETDTGTGFFDKKLKVVLGSFTYSDYGEVADGGRGNNRLIRREGEKDYVVKVLEGKEKVMNLADIPISLEIFQRWFNQSVVSPGKEQYLFSNFIRDLVVNLVPMALGQDCYEYAPKQKIRFAMTPITVNARGGFFEREPRNLGRLSTDLEVESTAITVPTRIPAEAIPIPSSLLPDESTTEDILYIYAETQSPYRLKGNYDEDSRKGIPHFYWGASTGIVKSISFSREDQPFLREANITRGMDDTSVGVSGILREKYNAAINLFGNNLYWPGQKVYVNPSVQTLGLSKNPESRIRELGFGGYYDIVKMESSILPGVFETKLETRWQCFGDGKYLDGEPTDRAADYVLFK